MSEIKVGEYVRTKEGYIAKLKEHLDNLGSYLFDKPIHTIESDKWTAISEKELEKQIVNQSPNIIDLIEIEDIVKVKDHDWIRVFNIDDEVTLKSFIEDCEENNWTLMSIVTKEQFQNIEYRLEE